MKFSPQKGNGNSLAVVLTDTRVSRRHLNSQDAEANSFRLVPLGFHTKGAGVPWPSCGAEARGEAATVKLASSGVTLVPKRQPGRSPTGARVSVPSPPEPCPREMPEEGGAGHPLHPGAGQVRGEGLETDVSGQN